MTRRASSHPCRIHSAARTCRSKPTRRRSPSHFLDPHDHRVIKRGVTSRRARRADASMQSSPRGKRFPPRRAREDRSLSTALQYLILKAAGLPIPRLQSLVAVRERHAPQRSARPPTGSALPRDNEVGNVPADPPRSPLEKDRGLATSAFARISLTCGERRPFRIWRLVSAPTRRQRGCA